MRLRQLVSVAAMLATVGFASLDNAAKAEDIQFVSMTAFANMQDRLDEFDTRMTAFETMGGDYEAKGGKGCYSGCACYCDVCPGWIAGVELVVLKPFFEDEVETEGDEGRFDYEPSLRYWLGYRNANGTGVRARYWDWDHTSADNGGASPYRMLMRTVDAEVTQMVCWGVVNANFFGGLRYAKNRMENDFGDYMEFEGTGPTLGAELLTPIACTNWSLVANARGSILFGQSVFDNEEFDGPSEDDVVSSLETQLGVQYQYNVAAGTLVFRSLVEAQYWMGSIEDPGDSVAFDSSTEEGVGLFGFVLAPNSAVRIGFDSLVPRQSVAIFDL